MQSQSKGQILKTVKAFKYLGFFLSQIQNYDKSCTTSNIGNGKTLRYLKKHDHQSALADSTYALPCSVGFPTHLWNLSTHY
jgi:hypothetical protein